MDEKRVKEEEKRPETQGAAEVPAGEKLDDQELDGAAGGIIPVPIWFDSE